MPINTQVYITPLTVRPDDIDMFGHVHSSRYMDYVLAARFEQMHRCYKMPMQEFLDCHLGWYLSKTEIQFLRPLKLGDSMNVHTNIVEMAGAAVRVDFSIKLASNGKVSAAGWANYVLVDIHTGKPKAIPEWVIQRYSLPEDSNP